MSTSVQPAVQADSSATRLQIFVRSAISRVAHAQTMLWTVSLAVTSAESCTSIILMMCAIKCALMDTLVIQLIINVKYVIIIAKLVLDLLLHNVLNVKHI